MTSNKNLMSTVAIILGTVGMLAFGGATASLAGSNDGGPFKFIPKQTRGESQAQNTKRNARSTPNAHDAYAQDRDWVGSAGTRQEFPRGAQGGW